MIAAERIFAEQGVTAPLDLICRSANVGRATLYRNFADRHALLVALLDRSMDEIERRSEALGSSPDGFFVLLRFLAEHFRSRAPLADYWRAIDQEAPEMHRARRRISDIVIPHAERAAAAGLCRADIGRDDIPLLVGMLGAALRSSSGEEREQASERALGLIVGGLATGSRTP